METHTAGRPQPPTVSVTLPTPEAQRDTDDDSWRYDRFDPETGRSRPASQRVVPPFPDSYHPPAGAPERPGEPKPPSARLRPLSDDVDGYAAPGGGRHRRQQHGEEWEQRRGSNIIERLMVRKQMEEAAKSFTRSAGLESRGLMRMMKPRGDRVSDRIALERRLEKAEEEVEVPAVRPTPVRSYRPALSDDDDEDVPITSMYSRYTPRAPSEPRYMPRPPSEPRQTRARSILDDDDDDDEIYTTYRRPAHHARTASLIAAANDDASGDSDEDITPYLRRPPRFLGARDWQSQRARSPRPAVSALDRDIQERRERHAELISSRNQLQSAAPPPAAPATDWQSEFDRYMKNIGTSKAATQSSVGVTPKPVVSKPKDLTSVRDWESRFNTSV